MNCDIPISRRTWMFAGQRSGPHARRVPRL